MKKILLFVALILLISFVMAVDGNNDLNDPVIDIDNNFIECTQEGQSMPVYPGYACCSGLVAINPQTTAQPLVGASICSNCGNGTCETWENQYNCPTDCETDDTNTESNNVKEQVKCVFNNTKERQKCYSFFGNETFSCTTEEYTTTGNAQTTCVADVAAPKGTTLVWKSSCDGYAKTIVDGENEYAKFDCPKEDEGCICTSEYSPVCGTVKVCSTVCEKNSIESNETSTCKESCYEERRTFGNTCEAKCSNAQDITKGKCGQTCPIYEQPYCPNGKIEVTYDDRGCKKPNCIAEEAEHFTGAYWQCSNGKEFKEVDTCMPTSFWKNKARNTCAQYSTKCTTSSGGGGGIVESVTNATTTTQQNMNRGTGNFILDTIATVTGTGTVSSTTVDSNTTTKCIGGEVYVTNFETFGSCTPGKEEKCKYYVNENGCKVKECIDGTGEESCPTDANIITTNTYKKAYWQCYSGKEFYEGGEGSCKPVDL